jgi:hypothetical protein
MGEAMAGTPAPILLSTKSPFLEVEGCTRKKQGNRSTCQNLASAESGIIQPSSPEDMAGGHRQESETHPVIAPSEAGAHGTGTTRQVGDLHGSVAGVSKARGDPLVPRVLIACIVSGRVLLLLLDAGGRRLGGHDLLGSHLGRGRLLVRLVGLLLLLERRAVLGTGLGVVHGLLLLLLITVILIERLGGSVLIHGLGLRQGDNPKADLARLPLPDNAQGSQRSGADRKTLHSETYKYQTKGDYREVKEWKWQQPAIVESDADVVPAALCALNLDNDCLHLVGAGCL